MLYLFFAAIFCATLLLLPRKARAWGPGVHAITGNWLLQNIQVLGLPMGSVVSRHPRQFLHGLLSADIFIGKGSRAAEGHSHNWESGFKLLARAENGDEAAFAYGYISHLAEDVVAHNVFVPGLLHTVPNAGRLAHVYLEAQADRLLDWESAQLLRLFKGSQSKNASLLLSSTLSQRAFSFWIKKQLFQSGIFLGASAVWRKSMRLLDNFIPERDRAILLDAMLTLSAVAMVDVLQNMDSSALMALDPIGERALDNALITGKKSENFTVLPWKRTGKTGEPELKIALPPELERLEMTFKPQWPFLKGKPEQ